MKFNLLLLVLFLNLTQIFCAHFKILKVKGPDKAKSKSVRKANANVASPRIFLDPNPLQTLLNIKQGLTATTTVAPPTLTGTLTGSVTGTATNTALPTAGTSPTYTAVSPTNTATGTNPTGTGATGTGTGTGTATITGTNTNRGGGWFGRPFTRPLTRQIIRRRLGLGRSNVPDSMKKPKSQKSKVRKNSKKRKNN